MTIKVLLHTNVVVVVGGEGGSGAMVSRILIQEKLWKICKASEYLEQVLLGTNLNEYKH